MVIASLIAASNAGSDGAALGRQLLHGSQRLADAFGLHGHAGAQERCPRNAPRGAPPDFC